MSRLFYQGLGKTIPWEKLPTASSITYDDVTLITQDSDVSSRKEIDTSVQFGPYKLTLPIINAPMDTVGSEELIRALAKEGGIGCLPRARAGEMDTSLEICARLSADDVPCLYAIGMKNALHDAEMLKKKGAKMILLDVAHGGMEKVKQTAVEIKEKLDLYVITGNIATYTQAMSYKSLGLRFARVGVGGGAVCITREVAGVGVPQLAAVFDTVASGLFVIADGGIKGPKDVAKAIAAGADLVMIGSLFAGTAEAPKIRDEKGNLVYRGQASASYMKDNKTQVNEFRAAEGVEVPIKEKGPVSEVLAELSGGLRSSMSYAGARTIKEFQGKAIFNHVSQAAHLEGTPHMRYR